MIVANEEAMKEHKLTPLARIVSWNSVGCDPFIMGIGPVYAVQNALKKANLDINKVELFEARVLKTFSQFISGMSLPFLGCVFVTTRLPIKAC